MMRRMVVVCVAPLILLVGCGLSKEIPSAAETPKAVEAQVVKNFPQEELVRLADAVKLSGTLEVPGYERGVLQIDVLPAAASGEGQGPITTARVEKPGPWSLLIPPDQRQVRLMAILDLDGDGPDFKDPFGEFEPAPLDVRAQSTDIRLSLDLANVRKAPPQEPAQQDANLNQDRPPWERPGAEIKEGEAAGSEPTPTGGGSTRVAPVGVPTQAAPGASGGPKEGVDPANPGAKPTQ